VLQNKPAEPILRKTPLLGLKYVDAGPPDRSLNGDFPACDGYRKPKGTSDGFITEKDFFGLFNMTDDIRQAWGLTLSADGVGYCDAALQDPALTGTMTFRRVNLMHAKALHQMAAGENAGALATLEAARAIKLDLPAELRADGFDMINAAETALALIRLGRIREAGPIIDRIARQRPYAIGLLNLADGLRAAAAPSLDLEITRAKARAALEPSAALRVVSLAILSRRMDDAAYLGEGLTFTLPDTGRWTVEGQNQARYSFISARAQLAGTIAYAEAARGQGERAGAIVKAARDVLQAEAAPPAAPANGGTLSKRVQQDYELRKSWATQGSTYLDGWEKAIALRQGAPALTASQVIAEARHIPAFPGVTIADLAASAISIKPGDLAVAAAVGQAAQTQIAATVAKSTGLDLQDLLKALPRPEVLGNQVSISSYAGWRCSLPDCARKAGEYEWDALDLPNRVSVRFSSDVGTAPTVQEYAILMAANLARTKGFDSFIIEFARTVNRTQNNMSYGRTVSTSNAGRESELVLRMFNKGNPPNDMKGAEWRTFEVAKVLSDFAARPGGGNLQSH
jgi:hypothetical protein